MNKEKQLPYPLRHSSFANSPQGRILICHFKIRFHLDSGCSSLKFALLTNLESLPWFPDICCKQFLTLLLHSWMLWLPCRGILDLVLCISSSFKVLKYMKAGLNTFLPFSYCIFFHLFRPKREEKLLKNCVLGIGSHLLKHIFYVGPKPWASYP